MGLDDGKSTIVIRESRTFVVYIRRSDEIQVRDDRKTHAIFFHLVSRTGPSSVAVAAKR